MFGGNLERMLENTMQTPVSCRKCGTKFTFQAGLHCALDNGIEDKVLMCKKCGSVYEADVTPYGVTLCADVTSQYKT